MTDSSRFAEFLRAQQKAKPAAEGPDLTSNLMVLKLVAKRWEDSLLSHPDDDLKSVGEIVKRNNDNLGTRDVQPHSLVSAYTQVLFGELPLLLEICRSNPGIGDGFRKVIIQIIEFAQASDDPELVSRAAELAEAAL